MLLVKWKYLRKDPDIQEWMPVRPTETVANTDLLIPEFSVHQVSVRAPKQTTPRQGNDTRRGKVCDLYISQSRVALAFVFHNIFSIKISVT